MLLFILLDFIRSHVSDDGILNIEELFKIIVIWKHISVLWWSFNSWCHVISLFHCIVNFRRELSNSLNVIEFLLSFWLLNLIILKLDRFILHSLCIYFIRSSSIKIRHPNFKRHFSFFLLLHLNDLRLIWVIQGFSYRQQSSFKVSKFIIVNFNLFRLFFLCIEKF